MRRPHGDRHDHHPHHLPRHDFEEGQQHHRQQQEAPAGEHHRRQLLHRHLADDEVEAPDEADQKNERKMRWGHDAKRSSTAAPRNTTHSFATPRCQGLEMGANAPLLSSPSGLTGGAMGGRESDRPSGQAGGTAIFGRLVVPARRQAMPRSCLRASQAVLMAASFSVASVTNSSGTPRAIRRSGWFSATARRYAILRSWSVASGVTPSTR